MSKRHSPGFLAMVEKALAKIEEIEPGAVVELQKSGADVVLVDVREDSEFALDACPDAVHMGKGVIERDVESRYPDKMTCLILYCGGGYRSALAALSLKEMGYVSVSSMAGGFRKWRQEGRPTRGGRL